MVPSPGCPQLSSFSDSAEGKPCVGVGVRAGRRMWFWLGSTKGGGGGLFPFSPLVHICLQLWSGQVPGEGAGGGGVEGQARPSEGPQARAGVGAGGFWSLLTASAPCLTMCRRCVGAAGFNSWAGKEMSWVMKTIAMEKAEKTLE